MLRTAVFVWFFSLAIFAPPAFEAKPGPDARFAGCEPACIEARRYKGFWLLNFYDSSGALIHVAETNLPVAFPLDNKVAELSAGSLDFGDGVSIQDYNSDAPAPPPGGNGTVTETVTGSGTKDGVSGTWVVTVIYTYVGGELVKIDTVVSFIPGPQTPDPVPPKQK